MLKARRRAGRSEDTPSGASRRHISFYFAGSAVGFQKDETGAFVKRA